MSHWKKERAAGAEIAAPTPAPTPIPGWLTIRTESPIPPTKIEIFRQGSLLASFDSPGFESSQGGEFTFPVEGLDLGIYARWENFLPGPRAVRLEAVFEGTEVGTYTLWGANDEASGTWRLPSIEVVSEPEEPSKP
jgi:hypothetical protein